MDINNSNTLKKRIVTKQKKEKAAQAATEAATEAGEAAEAAINDVTLKKQQREALTIKMQEATDNREQLSEEHKNAYIKQAAIERYIAAEETVVQAAEKVAEKAHEAQEKNSRLQNLLILNQSVTEDQTNITQGIDNLTTEYIKAQEEAEAATNAAILAKDEVTRLAQVIKEKNIEVAERDKYVSETDDALKAFFTAKELVIVLEGKLADINVEIQAAEATSEKAQAKLAEAQKAQAKAQAKATRSGGSRKSRKKSKKSRMGRKKSRKNHKKSKKSRRKRRH